MEGNQARVSDCVPHGADAGLSAPQGPHALGRTGGDEHHVVLQAQHLPWNAQGPDGCAFERRLFGRYRVHPREVRAVSKDPRKHDPSSIDKRRRSPKVLGCAMSHEPRSHGPERVLEHPFPTPQREKEQAWDVVVVGAGHAGIEAALAAARLGQRVALVSLRADRIGEMSCNPAIGGLGKGQIVREVDALGGAMARIADQTGIQFRMLNTRKGAAVRALRCQSDRHLYRAAATALVHAQVGVEVIEGAVTGLEIRAAEPHPGSGPWRVTGVQLGDGRSLHAGAVILTAGTFLRAVMFQGEQRAAGGRVGEDSADELSAHIERLGLRLGRLKTGTPPRLRKESLDFGAMEEQGGDRDPACFSYATDPARFPEQPQVPCHITYTDERAHAIIRENIHRAPMYMGAISGVGPRYCPSVEDKIMRFADRERHQIFVEPEGLDTDAIYVNGVSTSLPAEVQEAFVRTVPGLERAEFLRHGYAVEYDFLQPSQLTHTLAVRHVPGLYLAGQLNGTSGYEEAAIQGLLAGANAALWLRGEPAFTLGRHEAYGGVLVDDLILTDPREPYRMFTSRAEHRLLLRHDNADQRLTERGAAVGLVEPAALARWRRKAGRIAEGRRLLQSLRGPGGKSAYDRLRRPGVSLLRDFQDLSEVAALGLGPEEREALEVEAKYQGYIERQEHLVERMAEQEATPLPADWDYHALEGLTGEAKEKLAHLRPHTLGAAARIAGVRPPDVALLAIHLRRHREARTGAQDHREARDGAQA